MLFMKYARLISSKHLFVFLTFLLLGLVLSVGMHVDLEAADETKHIVQTGTQSQGGVSTLGSGNCRYGAAQLAGDDDIPFINQMDLGWKVDFNVRFARANTDVARYSPTVRFKPVDDGDNDPTNDGYQIIGPQMTDAPDGLGALIAANPGRLWLLGNEVDRAIYQDELYPQTYARAYHDVYHFIKDRDPTAQIAVSGLVQVSPNRLEYLDIMFDTYRTLYGVQMPVDVWNAHLYILPERIWGTVDQETTGGIALGTNPASAIFSNDGTSNQCYRDDVTCYAEADNVDLLRGQIRMMREWMHANGEGGKPLIVSEYGILWPYDQEGDADPNTCYLKDEYGQCFPPERTQQFLKDSVVMFESYVDPTYGYALDDFRMVQQWLWFGTIGAETVTFGLVNLERTALTPLGVELRDTIANRPKYINIKPINATSAILETNGSPTVDAALEVNVLNSGNMFAQQPFNVGFYRDSALTDLIGYGTVSSPVGGCTTDHAKASVQWSNLAPGAHQYWAYVNVGHPNAESDYSDNLITGIIMVDAAHQFFFPFVER